MTINQIQDQIIEEFSVFEDWMDRYSYLIELGKDLVPIDDNDKTDDYLIRGCQSQVWLNAKYDNGNVIFFADSDAIITKGMISLLIRVFSGQTIKEIIDSELYFVKEIGLDQHLSPTRANGLLSMIKQMKMYALAYSAKENIK
ncbi:MAG: SufE family protein [Bacteroidota bacterium]